MSNRPKYIYLEYLRVFCALAVICIHVSGDMKWYVPDMMSAKWAVQTMFNLAARPSTFIFTMITGALLLHPGKNISVHDIFHHYIRRILLTLITWTIIYDVIYTVMHKGDAEYFATHLFHLPNHFWYLFMLMGLYLATPVIRKITTDRKTVLYMIWLLAIFGVVFRFLPGISGFYNDKAGDNLGYSLWTKFLGNLQNMDVSFVPGYLCFFLLGHYIHEYGLGK